MLPTCEKDLARCHYSGQVWTPPLNQVLFRGFHTRVGFFRVINPLLLLKAFALIKTRRDLFACPALMRGRLRSGDHHN